MPLDEQLDQTYRILGNGLAIQRLRCMMISHHPEDVHHRYCGRCHQFHEQMLAVPYEHSIRLLSCVQAAAKGPPAVPPETLLALCLHTLEAVMGEETYARWREKEGSDARLP